MEKFQKRVGVLGGGQLGLMLAEAAAPLNIAVTVLDPSNDAPARKCAKHIQGDFKNAANVKTLVSQCDIVTYEIEHVDVSAVEESIAASGGKVEAQPTPNTIRIIQDKYKQKVFLQSHDIDLPMFRDTPNAAAVQSVAENEGFGYPLMLKSKTMAYDGRGNAVIKSRQDIQGAIEKLGGSSASLYVEKWVTFVKEIAIMVAKGLDGKVVAYPVVETIQKDNICHLVIAPAQIHADVAQRARDLACKAISKFEGAGIFGVEMFVLKDGLVLLNEIAPRPHNSGHYTIEACHTSQFEQHLRCILGLPFGCTDMKVGASIMLNILGGSTMEGTFEVCSKAMALKGAAVHWYGKPECRRGRKMGHITLTAENMTEAYATLNKLLKSVPGEDEVLNPKLSPLIGVIMGSDSDLPIMKPCALILKEFGIPFELTIVSAHRTPDRLMGYARSAHRRGLKVIIAAAGGAAHLPGMVAAITPLPVIGVPVALKNLDGVDSLHSIVQMPRGVPVATVAINNSTNAALLAVRMLGIHDPKVLQKMQDYQVALEDTVMQKIENLERIGWERYGQ